MKKIIYLISAILINFSCSYKDELYIDPILMPYWNQFNLEAERLGVNLNIKSVVLTIVEPEYKLTANALCYTTKKGAIIEISPRLFKNDFKSYNKRVEATVFHELGHGILLRHHNYEYYDSAYVHITKKGQEIIQSKTWPTSLMTCPASYKYYLNGEKREFYLRELFGLPIEKPNAKIVEYEMYKEI